MLKSSDKNTDISRSLSVLAGTSSGQFFEVQKRHNTSAVHVPSVIGCIPSGG